MTEVQIRLAEPHEAQALVRAEADRFNVVACGRRWGKTELGVELGIESAIAGQPVGWFAPTYKLLDEAWDRVVETLRPFAGLLDTNKTERTIKLPTGGRIDFWTLSPTESGATDAGRGRKYARVIVDEAAMVRYLENAWTRAIRPTLSDLRGDAWWLSTPRGHNYFHSRWTVGQKRERGWASWRMPTSTNPHISQEEIDAAREDLPADAFSQEYLAEFLADAANPFGITAIRSCIRPLVVGEVQAWGVDLAKSTDWTVAIGLDSSGHVVAFQRWQSDWRNTTARVAAMIGDRFALVDSTGVGDPIVEELQDRCRHVEGYKFTSASKQQIMEGLAVAIQRNEITFPDGPIVHELEIFQYEYKPSGVRYTAPEGMHDDCVDALALAVRALQMQPPSVRLIGVRETDTSQDDRFFDRVNDDSIWETM